MVARMALRGLMAALLFIAIAFGSTPAQADAAEVEALIAKGNELRRADMPGPALPYFQKAYDLARTPRTTGQLGLAELAAGYPVEAAAHLTTALESPNDPSIIKYRKILTEALTMARSQIGELALQGSPAGAEVVVDGHVAGTLPLASPIKLAAHKAEVVVRAPGYLDQRQVVPITGGQRQELFVNLAKVKAEEKLVQPPPPPPRPPPPNPPTSGMRTAAWVFGGGAIVAAGTGLALQLAASSNLSDFNASCKNDPTAGIVAQPGKSLDTAQCHDRYDAWAWQRRWSTVGYVAGGALAVTSGVLFLLSRPTEPTTTTARAHFQCAPTTNGVSCLGVF